MKDFDSVYQNKEDQWPTHLVCKHCKQRVERGIVSVSSHWMSCLERKEGLIVCGGNKKIENLDSTK